MDRDLLASQLRSLLEGRAHSEDVVAAYLFGSHGRGEADASSDVDLALWLRDAPKTLDDLKLGLAADLERDLGLPVDLVILNGAPSDLVHRVLRDSVLVAERDRSARIRFEVRARNEYFDMQPIRDEYRRGPRRAPA